MNYEYTEEELRKWPDNILEKIRIKYGLAKNAHNILIENILHHQKNLSQQNEKYYKESVAYFDKLPRELIGLTLLDLSYNEITNKCRLSKKVNSFCNDERFWRRLRVYTS